MSDCQSRQIYTQMESLINYSSPKTRVIWGRENKNDKNPFWYREIVFCSTSQIAGARTVNQPSTSFFWCAQEEGPVDFRSPLLTDAQNRFLLFFCGGTFSLPVYVLLAIF